MLPPVSSVSSTSPSHQTPTPQPVPAAAIPAPAKPASTDDAGMRSTAATRFNILGMSGPENAAEPLLNLAETLGKIINLPRREGEAGPDYLLRLAEAMKTLSPGDRANVAKLLNQIVQGVPLRLLAQAFANPAGPEAAKLVMLLDMAGYKDRDLAARAVVSSYRQNAGGELPVLSRNGAPPSRGAFLAAQNNPAIGSQPPAAMIGPVAAEAPVVVPKPQADAEEQAVRFPVGTNAIDVKTARGDEADIASPALFDATDESADEFGRSTTRPETTRSGTSPLDARSLQGQLRQTLAAPAMALAGRQASVPETPVATSEASAISPAESRIEDPRAAARPVAAGDRDLHAIRQMMAQAKWGGQEQAAPAMQFPLEAILLPSAAALKAARPVAPMPPDNPVAAAMQLVDPDEAASLQPDTKTAPTLPAEDLQDAALRAVPPKSEAAVPTAALLEQQMAQLRPALIRDGLPLPYIPYPVVHAFDDPVGTAADLHREHEEGEAEGFEEGDGGGADEQPRESEEAQADIPEAVGAEEPDPAYDLYRRMAGWS